MLMRVHVHYCAHYSSIYGLYYSHCWPPYKVILWWMLWMLWMLCSSWSWKPSKQIYFSLLNHLKFYYVNFPFIYYFIKESLSGRYTQWSRWWVEEPLQTFNSLFRRIQGILSFFFCFPQFLKSRHEWIRACMLYKCYWLECEIAKE